MAAIELRTEIPGPRSRELLARRERVVAGGVSIGMAGIACHAAEGAVVTDVDGNRLLDFTGGIGCLNAGHSAPEVLAAVREQAGRLQHSCFQVAAYEPYVALCEKLVDIAPISGPKKAALFNSGAEAVENAVKIARYATGRSAVVGFEHAFHGRTLLALSLTSKARPYRDGFGPFAPEIYRAPMPYSVRRPAGLSETAYVDDCLRRLEAFFRSTVLPERVAAVLLEPVLGEGGFIVPPRAFVAAVAALCRAHGIVLVVDEIQTGFGRTGRMFGIEHFGVEPDLMTLAKSMSAGYPLSAVVGRQPLLDAPVAGGLGGTFGGNPVSAAAALAAIGVVERRGLCARAEQIGARVRDRIGALAATAPCIAEVRGLGAMIGIEIVGPDGAPSKERTDWITRQCARRGLLLLSAGVDGNVLRTLMPLVISDPELCEGLDVLEAVLSEVT